MSKNGTEASGEKEEEEEGILPPEISTPAVEKEVPRVLSLLSTVLDRLIARNEQYSPRHIPNQGSPKRLTVFHGLRPPSISISKYLERIFKYTTCSPSCFVVGYIYIDRLVHKQPDLPVTTLNVHRLLVTSVMVATKMLDDVHFNNAFFARVGGISTTELNRLELEFLFRLDFKLVVSVQEFEGYSTYLEKDALCAGQRTEKNLAAFGLPLISAIRRKRIGSSAADAEPIYPIDPIKSPFPDQLSQDAPWSKSPAR